MTLLFTMLALLGFGHGSERFGPEPVPPPAPLVLHVHLPQLVPAGMTIPFRITLGNNGLQPVTVELGGRPIAFDLVVHADDGTMVWRRLEGVPVEAVLVTRVLAPGEVLTFEGHWDQRDLRGRPVRAGSYRVRGVLPVPTAPSGWGSTARQVTVVP